MISKIEINGAATFQGTQLLDGLKNFNYFFGSNGSGKTTISKIIANPTDFTSCSLIWENGTQQETRVYNRDFAERNFNPQLKGVFTLGEMEAETLTKIDTAKTDIEKLISEIQNLTNTLQGADGNGGKKAELLQLNETYKNKFWTMKQKHSDKLSGNQSGEGMRGSIGSTDNFMKKILAEANSMETLLTQSELEQKAETVFSAALTPVSALTEINPASLLAHEKNPILQKRIIGKDDVDIAAMIKKLGNSDWVKQGRSYYEANDGVCPFCQQQINQDFEESLNEYFDETFVNDSNAVNQLVSDYIADALRIQQQLQSMIDSQSEFLEIEKLKSEKQVFDSTVSVNQQRLAQKQKEASQVITLDSLENVLNAISALVTEANKKIDERNSIFHNLKNEKATLTKQIWKFVVSVLSSDITEYMQKKAALDSAISNLDNQITAKKNELNLTKTELAKLEKQTTTIVPTKDGINGLLDNFGFKSFKLDIGSDGKTYKLVRENGSEAHQTLSEGERNFVTFLYFYHLLKGSQDETGLANDKIVVFDDPISSLDNDVLFIVSTLIRELIQDVRDKKGSIKQIFILTHNIYFHKEITYNSRRKSGTFSEETFWLVKKCGIDSLVEKQTSNPIKTSYELLWDEVRKDTRNKATIQNTLRRILESYFKLLGNIPLDTLYQKFTGDDMVKCKALCSWINDGSHSAFDEDYYTSLDDTMIQKYLDVFKQIFKETDHLAHYNMMMGIEPEIENTEGTNHNG